MTDEAAQSPSSMNTQPWNVHVVTGDVLDRIHKDNTEQMIATGKTRPRDPWARSL